MCSNKTCKLKEKCYRCKAREYENQRFEKFKPNKKDGKIDCDNYIEITTLPYLVKDRPEKFATDGFREQSYTKNEERKARVHDKIIRGDWHESKPR